MRKIVVGALGAAVLAGLGWMVLRPGAAAPPSGVPDAAGIVVPDAASPEPLPVPAREPDPESTPTVATAPEPAPVPASVGSARIRVAGPDGKPGEGAEVVVARMTDHAPAPALPAARTGADGSVRFDGLAPGGYRVRVTAEGCCARKDSIRVEAGEVAVLELRLERGESLRGVVMDASRSEPLAGARVEAVPPDDLDRSDVEPLAAAAADVAGSFRLEGLPPGERVAIRAEAPGFVPGSRTVVLVPGDAEREIGIALTPGGRVEGTLRDSEGSPVAGARVLVAEQDEDGDDVLVRDPDLSMNGRRALTARTGEDGGFVVEGLPLDVALAAAALAEDHRRSPVTRDIRLTPEAPRARVDLALASGAVLRLRILGPDGNPPRVVAARFVGEGSDRSRWTPAGPGILEASVAFPGPMTVVVGARGLVHEARTVEVPASGVKEEEFRLGEGVAIEGVVVDQAGNPFPGVRLEPSPVEGGMTGLPMRWLPTWAAGQSDAEGRFRIRGLGPGTYRMNTRVGEDFRIDRERAIPAPSTGVRIVVARGSSASLLLRVPEGILPPDRVTVVRTVRRENDRSSSSMGQPWNGGRILWEDLPPGPWTFGVEARGFLAVSLEADVPPGRAVDLGERDLLPTVPLVVRVVDPAGAAVAGAIVLAGPDPRLLDMAVGAPEGMFDILARQGILRGTADGDGRATLPSYSHPEAHLHVRADGFLPSSGTVRLPGGSPATVVLRRGGRLEGGILRPDGTGATRVVLRFRGPEGEAGASGGTFFLDPGGRFGTRLPAGRYTVDAEGAGEDEGARGTVEVDVEEGGTASVEIRLAR